MNYLPKQALDAEIWVLGSIFTDNGVINDINLLPEDFYKPVHQEIFKAMRELSGEGKPIDIVSLDDRLKQKHTEEISSIASAVFTAANVNYHARIVKEAALLRTVQKTCLQTLRAIQEGEIETSDMAVSAIHEVTGKVVNGQGGVITSMSQVAKETLDYVERRYENQNSISGIPSGFKDLDKITDGFQGADLITLAARPGMGKSAFAMAIAQNASSQGFPIGVVSIEMNKHQIGIRTMASLSQVEMWRLRKGILDKEGFNSVINAVSLMANLPIYFSFSSWSIEDMRKVITQMVRLQGVKMVIVDYLQLIRNPERKNREREIGEISTTLKCLAKTFNIPIIALAQLNRQVEQRENKRPKLSDLRDSGQIEQDSDAVIFLYRENVSEHKGVVEVIFEKGRNIGLGKVMLNFNGDLMTFRDKGGNQDAEV